MAKLEPNWPHVVILGGGFGGLHAAKALRDAPVRITVVDRRNHHLFQPLLYQVATASLNPSEIASPIRAILRQGNVRVILGEAKSINPDGKVVTLTDGEVLTYDFLVVATGATHSYFGRDEWSVHAPGLKSIEDALEMRRRILLAFERAERERNPVDRKALMTFAIIGAGPTGVELAGALAEIAQHALRHDFAHIDPTDARIILIEGLDRVLPSYPEALSEAAKRSLERLGVEVRLGARVTSVDPGGVFLGEERLNATTILWAAGVAASPLGATLGTARDRAGRVKVTEKLTVPGHDDIFVIGDLAALEQDGKPVPGVAPAAMQGGRHAGRSIERVLEGKPIEPFRYWDRGSFSVIGRGSAVGLAFGARFRGFVAWLAWLFIHLMYLVGFKNRLAVLLNWAYSFLTFGRSVRLITYDQSPAPVPTQTAALPAPPLRPPPVEARH